MPETLEINQKFLKLLQNAPQLGVCKLFILGDLFEAWIGDDDHHPFHEKIIEALKTATTKGMRIYFQRGNRDFLIGKVFLRQTGCELLDDEHPIKLFGTSVLLMHGDTLCTDDIAYLRARKFFRSPIIQWFFGRLPLSLRRKLANNIRHKSQQHTQSTKLTTMDVTSQAVEGVIKKYQVEYLIHGHTHQPNIHPLRIQNKKITRIVLGAWHKKGNALVWDVKGKRALIEF
ncbi:MAG: UDP-2,3-diacylglucosamine diphosphatase [Gammaproteobacteria bacterium]|nr:UDP-2,3-diacylglucosamine diphosphatase [Gammaproteobacteria bacterium]